jgi:hypothetical protein
VDPSQPAYWLSRTPEEAAGFLARTTIASRAVGGFVKRAAGMPTLDPSTQRLLTNAAIGAGVGGLGGLGIGLFSRRRKNPLTSALSGAAIGGVLGGAVPEAYNRLKAYTEPVVRPPGPTDVEKTKIQAYEGMSPVKRLGAKLGLIEVPGEAPGPTGGVPGAVDPVQDRMNRDQYGDLIAGSMGQGLSSFGRGVANLTGFAAHPWASLVGHGAINAAQRSHAQGRQNYQDFMRGVDPYAQGHQYVPEVQGREFRPKTTTEDLGRKLSVTEEATPERVAAPVRNPATPDITQLANRYQGEVGTPSWLSRYREAQRGRQLLDEMGRGGERGRSIADTIRTGAQLRRALPEPGRGRRALEFGKTLAPHMGLLWGLNEWDKLTGQNQ